LFSVTLAKEFLMRYYPAALALAMLFGVASSASLSAPPQPLDPRAAALVSQGNTEFSAGRMETAIDAYEAALAVQPGNVSVLINLAAATRRQGMQGKALHYYREALSLEPQNVLAIAGEGAALVEKGAVEKARRNLLRLQGMCGDNCEASRQLAAAIAKGPMAKVVTAEAVKPFPVVSDN
jgi:tetratricopeptide (TPR) repeat protein